MYVLIFFHPKKSDRKRIRHKQKRTGFVQRRPFFHSHPHLFSVLGGEKEKKHIQLKINLLPCLSASLTEPLRHYDVDLINHTTSTPTVP